MAKKYKIAETTKVERERIAVDALGLSTLDADMPSNETMALMGEYIEGRRELADILQETIQKYRIQPV